MPLENNFKMNNGFITQLKHMTLDCIYVEPKSYQETMQERLPQAT